MKPRPLVSGNNSRVAMRSDNALLGAVQLGTNSSGRQPPASQIARRGPNLDGAFVPTIHSGGPDVVGDSQYRALFGATEWTLIKSDASIPDTTWVSLNREQRQAVFALRFAKEAEARRPSVEAKARSLFSDEEWQFVIGGNRYPEDVWAEMPAQKKSSILKVRSFNRPRVGPTVAEVMAEAKAAPSNSRVLEPWKALPDNKVMLMGLNAENLFRPEDDPHTLDDEFTTQNGYSQMMYYRHLQNVGDTLKSVNGGKGPDAVVIPETEDIETLRDLVAFELPKLGYQTIVLMEGHDRRGIDVGFISKHPLWPGSKPELIFPPGNTDGQRGVLRVELSIQGRHTVIYANHWKSMRDGEDVAAQINTTIAKALRADVAKVLSLDPNASIIPMGDLNTKMTTEPQPALEALGVQQNVESLTGDEFWDATTSVRSRREAGVDHVLLPNGTHRDEFLDRLMVNQAVVTGAGGLRIIPDSLVILPNRDRFFGRDPGEFNPWGVSDHRPYVAQFELI